jgi:hypothetical protein
MSHGFGRTKHPDSCIARNAATTEVCFGEVISKILYCSNLSASLLRWNLHHIWVASLFAREEGRMRISVTPHLHPLPLRKGERRDRRIGRCEELDESNIFISVTQRWISRCAATDLSFHKSGRYPGVAKPRCCDRLSGARPGDPEANPTGDRRDKLRPRRNRRWH